LKIIAAIQARMGSTRFPGKVLVDLYGKPVLQWVIEKAQKMNVDDVYVLTSEKSDNLSIIRLCENLGVRAVYKNTKSDVKKAVPLFDLECLYWYYNIGAEVRADYIIRICGDSPFIDVGLTNLLIDKIENQDYLGYIVYPDQKEFIQSNGVPAILTQYGIFAEIIKVYALENIMEHVTIPFYHPFNRLLKGIYMPVKYKLSIDYPGDLRVAKKVIGINGGMPESYEDINRIMLDNIELRSTGGNIQKYEWNNAQ